MCIASFSSISVSVVKVKTIAQCSYISLTQQNAFRIIFKANLLFLIKFVNCAKKELKFLIYNF